MSQEELAQLSGITRRTLQTIESGGKVRQSSIDAVVKVLAKEGVSWSETDRALHITVEKR